MADAVVRVQATANETRTDAAGHFSLDGLVPGRPVTVTAWAPGYFIRAARDHRPGATGVRIELERHTATDNPAYAWISAFASAGDKANCEHCHSNPDDPAAALPFDQWQRDAHSGSAGNIRFRTMYTGSDVRGRQSPFARFGESRRFSGTEPLVPAAGQPYYGPGFRLDYTYATGNCSTCHVPAGTLSAAYGADPTTATGAAAEGVTCDLCHKIWDVKLEADSGLPHRDRPGVLSYTFRRPPAGHQLFTGPLDDVAPGEDTYSPLQRRSEYCAGCHYGVFWDTTVYNSFGEWRDSPYSDPNTGQTCQDCHMPRGQSTHFADPAQGGLARDRYTISTHQMRGINDPAFMRGAVTVASRAWRAGSDVRAEVTITNTRTGHHVPTDSPLRQLILLVRPVDAHGGALAQTEGPTVPEWGGVGDPAAGYYAGQAGTAYAKILQEFRSLLAPTGAYWNPTRVLSDNRIPPFGADTTRYAFAAPSPGPATVHVTLLYRRAFIALADQKGWSDPDLVLYDESIPVQEKR